MARTSHLPTGTRFFARVRAAILECPRCGTVLQFGQGKPTTVAGTGHRCAWDKRTARLRCSDCGLVLMIGLLAWPVRKGGGKVASLPRDQVPNERQLAQLRAEASGFWLPEEQAQRRARAEDTNITSNDTGEPEEDQ